MPDSRNAQPYTWSEWESANYLEKQALRDKSLLQQAEAEGKVTRAKFLGSVMFTGAGFYRTQSEDLSASINTLSSLDRLLGEKDGRDAPSMHELRDLLESILQLVNKFLVEKEDSEEADAQEGAAGSGTGGGRPSRGGRASISNIRSRAEAYRLLSDAADYLMITEPHSPTPYLVKRAVAWGNMTLTQLLHEIVQDPSDLYSIYQLLGLKQREDAEGEEPEFE